MKHFDTDALTWDTDPKKIERATVFAQEIIYFIQPSSEMTALEFGCGTGLLSFELKDVFKKITLVDKSIGMINVLKEKINTHSIQNFEPLLVDIFDEENSIEKYDVLFTSLTLHHMVDLGKTFDKFNSFLKTNGYLCIADLVEEDGSFHAKFPDFDGHNGFEKEKLIQKLNEHHFSTEYYNECFTVERNVENKTIKYPVFMLIAKKIA